MIEQQTEKLLKENARLRELVRTSYVEGRLSSGLSENWGTSKTKKKLEETNA